MKCRHSKHGIHDDFRCKLDPNNEAYKRFSLQQLGKQWEQEGYVEGEQLEELGDETSLASMVSKTTVSVIGITSPMPKTIAITRQLCIGSASMCLMRAH